MAAKPKTIDEFLATVPPDQRAALEKIRRAIRSAAPTAVECINYGIPTFKLDGKNLVHFAGAKNHCSLFPGAAPLARFADELEAYSTSKGTLRFDPAKGLPASLVKKLVKARMEEIQAAASKKKATKKKSSKRASVRR